MAGIYIHIPFCKQRCSYCDFYKTTQVLKKPELVKAIITELKTRKTWLGNSEVKTIYFGGGTPSLLTTKEINAIIETVFLNFKVSDNPEITLESNPDDLSQKQTANLRQTPVNRLSIGIQSFQNDQLEKMNRRHNASQAIDCVKQAQDAGFSNISTDLIYGLPNLSMKTWEHDLEQMGKLNIQHLSAYHLTYEEGTVFDTMLKKGSIKPIKEEASIQQFKTLLAWAKSNGFEHYEISNFAKPNYYSKHNSSYWRQEKYLGIGPSAHSYNGDMRLWNLANLGKYLNGINENEKYFESETLSEIDKYNEYLMTWLRTLWGVNIEKVGELFGQYRRNSLVKSLKPFIDANSLYMKEGCAVLTDEGVFITDTILADLMILPNEE
ncbi:MAG: radical SAM family heme chaperone HemW [Salinivirgaceae bacterium]|jgi:oxygen-independent coproporphyrinogen-3 oxidase|nr:radical SAM family heme chaperone HemW [Salinivirgaceae bacterium]